MTGLSAIGGTNNLLQLQKTAAPAQAGAADSDDLSATPGQPQKANSDDKGVMNSAPGKSSSAVLRALLSLKSGSVSSS